MSVLIPYFVNRSVKLYHGDNRAVVPHLAKGAVRVKSVVTEMMGVAL